MEGEAEVPMAKVMARTPAKIEVAAIEVVARHGGQEADGVRRAGNEAEVVVDGEMIATLQRESDCLVLQTSPETIFA